MALSTIASGQKSSQNDLDQLVKALNGKDATSPVSVANRISGTMQGASAGGAMVGGVFTAADPTQGSSTWPSSQPPGTAKAVSPSSAGTSYQVGDSALDSAGCMWVATGNTSGGVTPFINVGKCGDNMRTRATVLRGSLGGQSGSSLNNILDWRGWDWGGIQWDAINGFLIPSAGYYQLTSSVHCTQINSTVQFRVNWQYVTQVPVATRVFTSYGDQTQSAGNATKDGGTMSEDIQFFPAGTLLTPEVSASGSGSRPFVGTAFNDPTPDDFTLFAIVEFLGATPST